MLKSPSKKPLIKRIIISVAFLIVAFLWPWWLIILIGLFLVFYFDKFYEFIAAGLILDGLYGQNLVVENFSFIFTFIITIVTVFLINFKKKLLIR